ncbi:TetR/AcrR family transcriptional regulator [Microvirga sp. 2TAF3]|uniref:TetR/AcrR family transcriptional regulator n=1 Tax=Microvirga sp. 2TAF3 TaxID=3233014 RepID=UPI003F9CBD19
MSTSKSEETSENKPYHHGDLRRVLIEAGRELVARKGPAALSLREVARAAGVSHNAPYRHFASREALLVAIAAEGFMTLRAALLAAMSTQPQERLRELGKAYVRFALEHGADFLLMFGVAISKSDYPELNEAADAAYDVLRRNVAVNTSGNQEIQTLRAWAIAHGLANLVANGQLPLERAFAVLDAAGPSQGSG